MKHGELVQRVYNTPIAKKVLEAFLIFPHKQDYVQMLVALQRHLKMTLWESRELIQQ